jgi:hypothetical protein
VAGTGRTAVPTDHPPVVTIAARADGAARADLRFAQWDAGKNAHESRELPGPTRRCPVMGAVVVLLLLALLFGGIGLFVEGLKWALIVALVLVVLSAFTGFRGRSTV